MAGNDIIVDVKDVHREFRIGGEIVRALAGISLEVLKGEYLSIMGPSGSGKSTLMNILGCLDVPTSGSYELDGIEVDVALVPVSGTYVMTAQEAVEACRAIQPAVAIPMHYGAIVGSAADAERFRTQSGCRVEVLQQEA